MRVPGDAEKALSMMYRERKENVLQADLNKICSGGKLHLATHVILSISLNWDYSLAGSKAIILNSIREALNIKSGYV